MRALFICFLVFMQLSTSATNYYISSGGLDSNDGLTTGTAWATLTKVNSATLVAGDSVLFRRGDTFTGQLVPKSGTVGNPIIYSSYETGSKPIISGFETLSGWTLQSGSIYRAATTAQTTLNMVIVDGVNAPKGRYPNTGYLIYESHSGNTSITDNQLTGTPDFTGSEVVVRTSRWKMDVATISSHSGSNLTFPAITDEPTNDYGYFIQNSPQVLDQAGEWYISGGYVYMYFSVNPTTKIVKAAKTDILVNSISKSYYTLENLSFTGANDRAIKIYNPISISIKNCDFSLCGTLGIESDGSPAGSALIINGCTFANINSSAVYSYSTNTQVKNSTISNIGTIPGLGNDNWGNYCGLSVNGAGSLVEGNVLNNSGYDGIQFRGNSTQVKNNLVDGFCSVLDDGGGIYTSSGTYSGRVVDNNIVLNGRSATSGIPSNLNYNAAFGIYLDEGATDVTISDNTVSNTTGTMRGGIFLHVSDNTDVTENTVYNCERQLYISNNQTNIAEMLDVNVTNNTFVAKEATQLCFSFVSNYNDLNFGSASGNVYARPVDDTQTFSVDLYNTSAVSYDLAGWKALSGYDMTSTKSPYSVPSVDSLYFQYNATSDPVVENISGTYKDMSGVVSYTNTVSIPAYSSVVLLKSTDISVGGALRPWIYNKKPWVYNGKFLNGN